MRPTLPPAWGVEGDAEIIGPDDPHPDIDSEASRLLLRDIFRAAGGTHDDWDTYDRVMADERRAAVLIAPPPRLHQPPDLMTRDDVLDLCAALPGAVEDYPFGEGVAVFKVGGRMFALIPLEGSPGSVNLKCDPELALELRARYPSIRPGYHQNKRHWNNVELDSSIEDSELRWMIDHSYELVTANLPRALRSRFHGS